MRRLEFASAGPLPRYCECLPSGAYAVLGPAAIDTHVRPLALPQPAGAGIFDAVLYLRITDVGGFQIAGQSHGTLIGPGQTGTWLWHDGWTLIRQVAVGVSPVIFGRAGQLHISDGSVGVNGYRYVREDGAIVSGDATYADPSRVLGEYTEHGDIAVGQSGFHCVALHAGKRYIVETGNCTFIRFNRTGDDLAIAIVKPDKAVLLWLTVAELRQLPQHVPATSPPPAPPTPPMTYQRRSPDYTDLVQEVAQEFPREWETARKRPDGTRHDAFIRRFAWEAAKVDPNIGLNGKRGTDEISTDAVSYKNETGPGGVEVIDIITGDHRPVWQDRTLPEGNSEVPGGHAVLGKYIAPTDPGASTPAPVLPNVAEFVTILRGLEARVVAAERLAQAAAAEAKDAREAAELAGLDAASAATRAEAAAHQYTRLRAKGKITASLTDVIRNRGVTVDLPIEKAE